MDKLLFMCVNSFALASSVDGMVFALGESVLITPIFRLSNSSYGITWKRAFNREFQLRACLVSRMYFKENPRFRILISMLFLFHFIKVSRFKATIYRVIDCRHRFTD